jgi:hypothetical protein
MLHSIVYSKYLLFYLLLNLYHRLMNIQIGEASRRTWLGEEADPQYSDRLLRAYKRSLRLMRINKTPGGLFPRMQLYLALVFWASSRVDLRQHYPSLVERVVRKKVT